MKPWGLLPEDVREFLLKTEWDHSQHLTARLLGERPFPVKINLRPPVGKNALDDLPGFHAFIHAWQAWPSQHQLSWKDIQYVQLGKLSVPSSLTLGSIQELVACIGEKAITRSLHWQRLMSPILEVSQALYPTLVKHLKKLESMSQAQARMIARLLPQLTPGMGRGCYLRALPIAGVDTKFLETHLLFVSALLDQLHQGTISSRGGIMPWLDCISAPGDWLLVRPLCTATLQALGGIPVLRIPTEVLLATPLPGDRILVVENDQSGYGLPTLPSTVAVIGGGGNLAWMTAPWLKGKPIGYWGDLDTWGFAFLSEARRRQPQVESLLMDEATLLRHREQMVPEPDPYPGLPEHLTEAERKVFQDLREGRQGNGRLEQEKLAPDYLCLVLRQWG